MCVPFPGYKKITGLDLIRIQGGCTFGCYNKLSTFYSYQVFMNAKYSDYSLNDIIWQEFEMTGTYFSSFVYHKV